MHAVNGFGFGAVDVTANHAVGLMTARHGSQRAFVFCDEFDSGLGLEFQKRRQRPVAETQHAAQAVEIEVEVQNPVVKVRPQFFQQMIEMRQAIRLMPVDDQKFFAVRRGMHRLPGDGDVAKLHAHELLDELVVVAADVNHLGLLAAFAKQLLDEHVVIVAPEPAEFKLPAINEIADEVKVFAVHQAQEIQQFLDPRVAGAQVNIRNPDRAADERFVQVQFQSLLASFHAFTLNSIG